MNETIITNNVLTKSISKKLDWDVNVPDSKRDVLKILSSFTECSISDYSFQKDCCNIKLEAISRILYIPEDASSENICTIETKENFSVKVDIPSDLAWEYEDIHIKCLNEPCVLINSRKLGVRLSANIIIELYKNTEAANLQENDGIVLLKNDFNSTCIHCIKNEKISISPAFSLPSGKPAICEVLKLCVKLMDKELKPITNKAVFKGNIHAELLYISDISTIETVLFETPFTEIIDMNGIDDSMQLMYSADVKKACCELILGEDNFGKGVNISGVIDLRIKACTTGKAQYVVDAYSPMYEEGLSKRTVSSICFSDVFTDTVSLKEVLEFEDTVISEVYSVWTDVVTRSAEVENGRIMISASLCCKVLYRTQSGMRCETKNINFEHAQNIDCDTDYESIDIMCEPENLSFVIAGNNMLEIRCNVKLSSYLSSQKEITAITSINLNKETPKKLNRAPVVAYFPQNDETLFAVAKKYSSTPDRIKELNSLSEDWCRKGTCVIIE